MFSSSLLLAITCLYMGLLFLTALITERRAQGGNNPSNHPVVYSLSLAVYCTSWTYYGSVGKAANSGMLFLAIYLGPTLVSIFWWTILRQMVRIKNTYRITSIADFISLRYDKSQAVAALATIIALVGLTPYIALQLKSVVSTFGILTQQPGSEVAVQNDVGILVVALMILFTVVFGARRIDPTERHQGLVMAVVLESVVKLVAFLAVGIFVTYYLYDGFGDIIQRFQISPWRKLMITGDGRDSSYLTWASYLVLSMSAIMFLPRQFHVAVVENFDERHIPTAMWLFPVYMIAINLFVVPMAMTGLLSGHPVDKADMFVLLLPMAAGQQWLSLMVFLGGFSVATAM
ncbi:MAG: diguanylate cyclase, partial [Deltaproteobacteria bacterium]|nr:diguanylate cyclase [Deltaproteobacteria bacterium]